MLILNGQVDPYPHNPCKPSDRFSTKSPASLGSAFPGQPVLYTST